MDCTQIRHQLMFYLDDELVNEDRQVVERHLEGCAICQSLFEQERHVLEEVRAARPLYTAPPALRAAIVETLQAAPAPLTAPPALRSKLDRMMQPRTAFLAGWLPARRLSFAVLTVMVALAGFWVFLKPHPLDPIAKPSEFALMAVDTHLRRLRGQLPLEIVSESPVGISDWFNGKVSFTLKLPNYQESSGQEKLYRLEGARLVALRNDYAAYVAYRMQERPISLVVTTQTIAVPSGGEQITSKGLKFHCDSFNGFKVITWSDRGLTYALVSDLEERGQQSCLVCHAGTKDRDFVEGLRISQNHRTQNVP